MKNKLTPAQLAALAAGATMAEVLASAGVDATDSGQAAPDAQVEDPVDAQAAQLAQDDLVIELAAEVETLKAENAEQATQLADLQAKLETAEAGLTTVKAAADTMTETILGRVKNMSIALNATAPENCEDPVALVALHTDLDAQFKEKFKAGRVAASSSKPEEKQKPMWTQAQLDAARAIPVYN